MKRTAFLIGVTLCVAATNAGADVIGQPEDIDCPAGSRQQDCHGSQYCEPRRCTDASDCGENATCEEVDWCIDTWSCSYEGPTIEAVVGGCGSGSCSDGTCQTLTVCTPAEIFNDAGGACSAPSRLTPNATVPAAGLALAVAAILLGCWLRRRTRR